MENNLKQTFSHILWIGGATDTGKTTIAKMIAERHGLQQYNYDRSDLRQITILAQSKPHYRAFLEASLDENWVDPEPEELLTRTLQSFMDRFPLVLEDLLAMPKAPLILAEGFGFTPELIAPLISSKYQAVWLVPTETFKWASMQRRNKPSFRDKVRDPQRATANVLKRDMLLAAEVEVQAGPLDLQVYRVDGSRMIDEMVSLVERHFEPFLK